MRDPSPVSRPARLALLAALFASGAAGLIYETVWTRQLSCSFSGTAVTTCLVLSAFMGGMALGSVAAGRRAARLASPLGTYAGLELTLALAGLVYPRLLTALGDAYLWLARALELPGRALLALEFPLFLVVLALPAVLMGATLPLVTERTVLDPRRAGTGLGLLYGVNSAGGVLGSLAAGFWMIEHLGLAATSNAAAVLNVGAAILAALVAAVSGGASDEPAGSAAEEVERPAVNAAGPDLALVLVVSGFTAMAYEVLWTRILSLVLGSSTYSFALMLATFVAGVTLGSLLYGLLGPRLGDPARLLGASQLAIGAWALTMAPMYGLLPYPFLLLRGVLGFSFQAYEATALLVNALVMLVPATLFGLGFPAAVQAAARRGGAVSRTTGELYAANTLGNVTGSLATGLVLIPFLGMALTVQLVALASAITGLALLAPAPGRRGRAWAAAAVVLALLVVPEGSRSWLGSLCHTGASRVKARTLDQVRAALALQGASRQELLAEDSCTTVAVTVGRDRRRTLWVNGKVDGSDGEDMPTQVLLAQLPLLAHSAARRVFVLGLGTGVTAASALSTPGVERVDCAEISAAAVEAARCFGSVNGNLFGDARFHLAVDDGRHALQLAREPYDVIIMEPSNPWMAGITNLYTVECLTACRARLAPGGLMLLWSHLYEMDEISLKMILGTFRAVFPDVRVFQLKGDLFILGSPDPRGLAVERIVPRLVKGVLSPSGRSGLGPIGITYPFTLLAHEVFDRESLREWTRGARVLTDDTPDLEFTAPVPYYQHSLMLLPDAHLPLEDSCVAAFLAGRAPDARELLEFARLYRWALHPKRLAALLTQPGSPPDPRLWALAGEAYLLAGQALVGLDWLERARSADPRDATVAALLARAAERVEQRPSRVLGPRSYTRTRKALEGLLALSPGDVSARLRLAMLSLEAGDEAAAVAQLEALPPLRPDHRIQAARMWLQVAQDRQARGAPGAVTAARAAHALEPSLAPGVIEDTGPR